MVPCACLFIFDVGSRRQGSNSFRNSSYKEKTAGSARVSRLSFRFLWLGKNQPSQNFDFLGKKVWRNAIALKSKKVQDIFGETFILALSSSVYKSASQISFDLFCSRYKRLSSEFLRNWGWFHEYKEHFPKYLG